MIIVELEQGSQKWLDFRKDKIGASDFATIAANAGLCDNIYNKSLTQLALSKRNSSKTNEVMQTGHNWESIVREEIIAQNNCIFPALVGKHNEHQHLIASFDGFNQDDNMVLEIKTITTRRKKFNGLLQYFCYQMIHQCYIADVHKAILCVFYESDQSIQQFYLANVDHKWALVDHNDNFVVEISFSQSEWLALCNNFYNQFIQNNNNILLDRLCQHRQSRLDQVAALNQEIKDIEDQIAESSKDGAVTERYSITPKYRTTTNYESYIKQDSKMLAQMEEEAYTSIAYDYTRYAKDYKLNIPDEFKDTKQIGIAIKELDNG